jgi:hypothetical protein
MEKVKYWWLFCLSMPTKYRSFQDLPTVIAKRLKARIVEGSARRGPAIPEDDSMDERIRAHRGAFRDPDYDEDQLAAIVDAFVLFNNAVKRGLPNQLYQMMARALDTEIAGRAYAANAIWYAHEGGDLAKDYVQAFADEVKAEIDKRARWGQERFHREYFLDRE